MPEMESVIGSPVFEEMTIIWSKEDVLETTGVMESIFPGAVLKTMIIVWPQQDIFATITVICGIVVQRRVVTAYLVNSDSTWNLGKDFAMFFHGCTRTMMALWLLFVLEPFRFHFLDLWLAMRKVCWGGKSPLLQKWHKTHGTSCMVPTNENLHFANVKN